MKDLEQLAKWVKEGCIDRRDFLQRASALRTTQTSLSRSHSPSVLTNSKSLQMSDA